MAPPLQNQYRPCSKQQFASHTAAPSQDSPPATPASLWASLSHPLPLHHSSHLNKVHSFDSLHSFHGDLTSADSPKFHGELLSVTPAASSTAIPPAGHHHHYHRMHHDHHADHDQQDRLYMRHQSAPLDVAVPSSQWRSCREERAKGGYGRRRRHDDEEEEEEGGAEAAMVMSRGGGGCRRYDDEEVEEEVEEEEERLPPHELLAREWADATSCGGAAFSLCQGAGRTLKGRDLCRVRTAILKQTGFI